MAKATLNSRLSQIAKGADKKVNHANRLHAESIKTKAQAGIPKDTGRTAEGIEVEKDKPGYRVTVPFPGHLLEWGSVKMSARPFLTPAGS